MTPVSFFRPDYFWAFFFVAVIIIIHFVKRPRLVSMSLSTLRFFSSDSIKSSRTKKILQILQLLLRIAAVIAIILLFARPYNSSNAVSAFNNPQASVFIWVDNTFSMEYVENGRSLRDRVSDVIDSLRQIMPGYSKLYMFDHTVREFIDYSGIESILRTPPGIIDIKDAFLKFEQDSLKNPDAIFLVFSDFQKRSAQTVDSLISNYNMVKSPVVLVSCAPLKPWNYSVQDVAAYSNAVKVNIKAQKKPIKAADVIIKTGKIKAGEINVSVKHDSDTSVFIETGNASKQAGLVELEAADPMLFDNRDYFSPDNKAITRILIAGDTVKNNVMRAAIIASSGKTERAVSLFAENKITFDKLDSSDIIIINALSAPSRVLNEYLQSGGTSCKSVLCCIGTDELSFVWFRELLTKIFPDKASELHVSSGQAYPVLPDTISEFWKNFPSRRITELFVNEYAPGFKAAPLALLSNNDPFMWSSDDGRGRTWIILSTSAGITDENNLFQTGFYVALLDRCISVLNKNSRTDNTVLNAGESYRNIWDVSAEKTKITDISGEIVSWATGTQKIRIDKPGIYSIISEGYAPVSVKVRVDPQESSTEYLIPEVAKSNSRNISFVECQKFIGTVSQKTHSVKGMVLWLILILLLLSELFTWNRSKEKVS